MSISKYEQASVKVAFMHVALHAQTLCTDMETYYFYGLSMCAKKSAKAVNLARIKHGCALSL